MELNAKYTALAAIYDYDPEVVDSVNPWKDNPEFYEGIAYTRNLTKKVPRIPKADELHLYVWIEEIEKDLKVWAMEDGSAPTEAIPVADRAEAGDTATPAVVTGTNKPIEELPAVTKDERKVLLFLNSKGSVHSARRVVSSRTLPS